MTQSHKTRWQEALLKSGLGARAVGTGLAMVVYANADGTRMFPSMPALAEDMGCDRKYVTGGRDTLKEYGWLLFVAKAVPNRRGIEFFPTFGRREGECPSQQHSQDAVSVPLEPVSVPLGTGECPSQLHNHVEARNHALKTMEVDHGSTGKPVEPTGKDAWDNVKCEAYVKALAEYQAKAAAEMERAPSFD